MPMMEKDRDLEGRRCLFYSICSYKKNPILFVLLLVDEAGTFIWRDPLGN